MIKTYLKTLWRMFKKHITRFLSLLFMVLIAVSFVSGIGSSTDKIKSSLNDYYKNNTVSDFIIKSTSPLGFVEQDVGTIKRLFPECKIQTLSSFDIQTGEKRSQRYYFIDFSNWVVNTPKLIEGEFPRKADEVLAERADNVIKGYSVGEKITVNFGAGDIALTVSGIIQSPLTFANDGEPSYNNPPDTEVAATTSGTKNLDLLENVLYISNAFMPQVLDIQVAVKDRNLFQSFSSAYTKMLQTGKENITSALSGVEVITLNDNYSFKSLNAYADKVLSIGIVLMVAFLAVTALVALSTMTRLLEEERQQIACLKTLGYSSLDIISKYLLFALIATGAGGAGAYFVGIGIMRLIYYVFNYSFYMPPVSSVIPMLFYVVTFIFIVAATLAATAVAGIKMTNERPANLLRPKPPKSGKKVIFEKIPFLWNRLPFRYKSTCRNVLRYKSRFIMTVIAVAVSMSLMLAGFALLDLCLFNDFGSAAIMGIATVIVIFAGLLTMVVIYTLTNINISERNREIATLMVLGYCDNEVAGYIYREVYVNTTVGIIFGYPLSLLLMHLVFSIMAVGGISGVTWFWWIVAPLTVFAFTGLVSLLLLRKIVKVNMNESLKAIE